MVSLGEELKRERELREISLREISDATKISVRILDAIEHDNYRILPGGVFNRNFLRAYAGFIGIDPENVVRKYLQQFHEEDNGETVAGLGTEAKSSGWDNRKKMLLISSIILLILVAVAVVLAGRYYREQPAAPDSQHSERLPVPGAEQSS